jgi:hypothetical protein
MTASVFSVITVTSAYPSTQIIAGSNPPVSVLVYNADPLNTIWFSDNDSFIAGNVNNCSPLPPLSSVSFDGTGDVYAATSGGVTANLQLYPTGSAFFGQSQITQLAQIGTPGGAAAATLTPGASFPVLSLAPIGQYNSYDLNMYVTAINPGALAAVMTVLITLQWFDNPLLPPVFEEDWQIWAGRANPVIGVNTLSGNGPMHGQYLSVTVTIPGGAANNAVLQYINIFGSPRVVPFSDWRQNAGAVNPQNENMTIIPPSTQQYIGFDNTLAAAVNFACNANTTYWQPCSLYSGPAYLRFESSNAPTTVFLVNCQYLVSGALIPGAACPGILFTIGAGTTEITKQLNLPRAPCAIVIQNGSSVDTVSFELVAQQAA